LFGVILDDKLASSSPSINIKKTPDVLVLTDFDEKRTEFSSVFTQFTVEDLANFIKTKIVPLIDDLTPESYRFYIEQKLPLSWIFINPNDVQKAQLYQNISPLAKQFQGSINFCFCDGIKYQQQAQALGLSSSLPGFVITSAAGSEKYVYGGDDLTTTSANLKSFIDDFIAGKLEETIKSQPIPEQGSENDVVIVVGSTFDKIVRDPTKDVLIELYAPWCGHCKNLAPIYEQLAQNFKPIESVVIAKMDATENDATGIKVEGFPTLYFFPANSNNNKMIKYDGENTLAGLTKFIQKNAAIKFTLPKTDL